MAVMKILICDDSNTDLLRLKEVLDNTGAVVITARSGSEAVRKARSEKPSLIFLDIVMDEMDGYEACREMKSDPELANIPVIFVSSKNQKADHLWASRQGGDALIGKPFDDKQIIEQVNRHS